RRAGVDALPSTASFPARSTLTVTVRGAAGAPAAERVSGSATPSAPGASAAPVTRKIARSTRKTSVSGVMSMSVKPASASSPFTSSAMRGTLRGLAAIESRLDGSREGSGRRRRPRLERVVGDHREDGDDDAGGRRDERLGDASRDDVESGGAAPGDVLEGAH